MKVREIIKMMEMTHVPKVPPHVKGVINLRGKVIPIDRSAAKFGLRPGGHRAHVHHRRRRARHGERGLGFIVDAVSEVLNIAAAEIEPTPDFGEQVVADYMLGLAKVRKPSARWESVGVGADGAAARRAAPRERRRRSTTSS